MSIYMRILSMSIVILIYLYVAPRQRFARFTLMTDSATLFPSSLMRILIFSQLTNLPRHNCANMTSADRNLKKRR